VNLDTGAVGGSNGKKAALVELLGTFFLSLALFNGYDTVLGAFACGVMLALSTWLGSGAYNPAVTVARIGSSIVGKGLDKSQAASLLPEILAQVAGATLATLFASTAGGAIDVSPPSTITASGHLLKSSVIEALFVIQLVLPYFALSSGPLAHGLSYFSGLFAFGASVKSTGNPAVVIGTIVGNAVLGNGFAFSNAAIARCTVPLVAGSFAILLFEAACRESVHSIEGVGTFYLALATAGILKQGSVGSSVTVAGGSDCYLAIGTTLATWLAIGGGSGSYNPAVTLARYVRKDRGHSFFSSALKGPALDILAQILGALVASIASSWAMNANSFQWLALDPDFSVNFKPAIIDCLATAALALTYIAKASAFDLGLAYFGLLFSFATAASTPFNPALPVGSYLAGLAGFGGGGTAPFAPLIGALSGAILAGMADSLPKEYFPSEAIGAFYVYLVVGKSSGGGVFGALAIGATVLAFTKISGADLNPSVTLGASYNPEVNFCRNVRNCFGTIVLQLAGASVAGILCAWLTGFDGTATEAFSIKAASAEVLASVLLVKAYPIFRSARDPQLLGVTYFALLAAFFSSMGSVANPALVIGRFVGSGLLPAFGDVGSGFDLSEGALKALLAHLLAPLVGAALCSVWKKSLKIEVEYHKILDKLKWSRDMIKPGELCGSFFLVVLFSAIGSESSEALLACGCALTALLTMITGQDLIPSITVGRIFSGMTCKTSRSQIVELLLSICFQTLGAVLAIYATAWLLGTPAGISVHGASIQEASIRGFLITLILSLGWLSQQGHLATGLSYFVAASTCSGNLDPALAINPALVLANYLHGVIAGHTVQIDGALLVVLLVPLFGGLTGGFLLKLLSE
jgi:glycerol uptake facilitator-like aquaporin